MAIPIFTTGVVLILLGSLLFLASWILVVKNPAFLVGTITMLWFKTLTQVVGAGLILAILGAADQIFVTALFWRR